MLYGSDRIKINQTREMNEIGLESVTSYLTLQATPSVFINGKMALNCSVHMYNIYRETYSVHITEDTPHIAHVLGVNSKLESELVKRTTQETYSVHITEDTPHIAHVLGVNSKLESELVKRTTQSEFASQDSLVLVLSSSDINPAHQ
ncbi:hypothetical protein M8J77_013503 [Diaphorina citri]|nr:hypothetical protein M8J77_013503 [Diaphorina citri]